MGGFVLTLKAKEDLKAIARYTQDTWGREQRNRYLAELDRSFRALATDPLKGRDCGDILPGYRKHKVGRHWVFYRRIDADDHIEIVRVLHGRMDVRARMNEVP
jgi:toxin ParE1/3/4